MVSQPLLERFDSSVESLADRVKGASSFLEDSNESLLQDHRDLYEETTPLIEELRSLAGNLQRQKRVARAPKVLVMFGKFSTGKTTLVNALMKRCYSSGGQTFSLPTADDPTTAKPIRIRSAPGQEIDMEAAVVHLDGREESIPVEQALTLCTSNSDHREVIFSFKQLGLGSFELLDIPGTDAAFFKRHDKIVRDRLRDAAVVIWLAGGVDRAYPSRDEVDLLRNTSVQALRPVIPVWNGFQDMQALRNTDWASLERAESLEDADEFYQYTRDLGLSDPNIVYAMEASEFDGEDHVSASGIMKLREDIELKLLEAKSGLEIAMENIESLRSDATLGVKRFIGVLHDALDRQKDVSSYKVKGSRLIDEFSMDCRDIIASISKSDAQQVTRKVIVPALKDFVISVTSPGGALSELASALRKNPLRFKQKMEEELTRKLTRALNLDSEQGTFLRGLRSSILDAQNQIDRRLMALTANLSEILSDVRGIEISDLNGVRTDGVVESLSVSTASSVNGIVANMAVVIAAALGAFFMIASPKTGTPVDVVIALVALVALPAGMFMLRRRMLGQVNATAGLFDIEIRHSIREPLLDYLNLLDSGLHEALLLESTSEVIIRIETALKQTRDQMDSISAVVL